MEAAEAESWAAATGCLSGPPSSPLLPPGRGGGGGSCCRSCCSEDRGREAGETMEAAAAVAEVGGIRWVGDGGAGWGCGGRRGCGGS